MKIYGDLKFLSGELQNIVIEDVTLEVPLIEEETDEEDETE